MSSALLDTSFVVDPPGEGIDLPEQCAISSMTIAELHKGVLVAATEAEREARVALLAEVEARFSSLSLDTSAARVLGRYMADAKRRRQRTGERLRVRDAIIAATAEANALTVYTRDDEFRRFGSPCVVVG
ncbi:MAG: PIN domain-containing protein [Thermoleophilaceae bacterium]